MLFRSPQLIIDSTTLMTFGPQDMEPALIGHALTQYNIRTTTRHVGGDRHSPLLACHGNNFGFLLMILGIQDLMGDPSFF